MRRLVIALVVFALVYHFAQRDSTDGFSPARSPVIEPRDSSTPSGIAALPVETSPPASFQCDGRTHCSQMNSCAEAKYFLNHCPNTEMDGDGDGVPCERQWCN